MHKVYILFTLVLLASQCLPAQTMQLKFCGKTSLVEPATDNQGNDQRHKGALRLDYLRVGRVGSSKTNPFYSLGVSGGTSFKNFIYVDGCQNNSNTTYCSGCSRCYTVSDAGNKSIGVFQGKMLGNVRTRSVNNDLFLESTGDQNVVCFVTDPFDVSGHGGKKVEINAGYEGTQVENFSTKNVSCEYRYNSGNWVVVFNQNSNFLRVIDTTLLVLQNVPVATLDFNALDDLEVFPNPTSGHLIMRLESKNAFTGTLKILDLQNRVISETEVSILSGTNSEKISIANLPQGMYLLQLSDASGRSVSRKFTRQR
ncbi:MAG: T9SS type A sorting domain-containing protein [Saprospiraceae bacterium]|nr:T9SS type A sorting domain-containing protein [Saprospiraceae bacterium]